MPELRQVAAAAIDVGSGVPAQGRGLVRDRLQGRSGQQEESRRSPGDGCAQRGGRGLGQRCGQGGGREGQGRRQGKGRQGRRQGGQGGCTGQGCGFQGQ